MRSFRVILAVLLGTALTACGGSDEENIVSGDHCLNCSVAGQPQILENGPTLNKSGESSTSGRTSVASISGTSSLSTGGNAQSTGGSSSATGGSAPAGGSGTSTTGGNAQLIGGSSPATGGSATGGNAPATGGSSSATGGSSATTGGSQSTGGSSSATGGSAPAGGSGTSTTGGNAQLTGGSSPATGGSATGGNAQVIGGSAASTGGNAQSTGGSSSATGGSAPAGGSGTSTTGGSAPSTGGSGNVCVPSPRPAVAADSGPAITCTPTLDPTFPTDRELNGEIVCLTSSDDCFLLSGTEARNGDILHKSNGSWVAETLPTSVLPSEPHNYKMWFYGISGTRSDNMWASGAYGGSSPKVLRRSSDGSWSDMTSGLVSKIGWNIYNAVTIWASEDSVFVATSEHNPCPDGCTVEQAQEVDAGIYRFVNGAWQAMDVPHHEKNIMISKLWGTSNLDVFATGCVLDMSDDGSGVFLPSCISGVLWHYDGCAWSDFSGSLPQDVRALNGVHGSGGTVVVVGGAKVASDGDRPVRLFSTADLSQWQRSNGLNRAIDGYVFMAGSKNVLVGGSAEDAEYRSGPGDIRISLMSDGVWGNSFATQKQEEVVAGIARSSDNIYISTQGNGAWVYTCQ